MKSMIVFVAVLAFAAAIPSGHWDHGHGGVVIISHDGHNDDGHWDNGHHSNVVHGNGAVIVGASGLDNGHNDDGHWDHGHGHYSNVVHGNGAVTVGAAGGVRNDVHGHGVAIVGPPTATVKIVGPGRTGKIVAHGLWGVHHGHHGNHGHHW